MNSLHRNAITPEMHTNRNNERDEKWEEYEDDNGKTAYCSRASGFIVYHVVRT